MKNKTLEEIGESGSYDKAETWVPVKRGTLYNLVHKKQIPHTRLGGRHVIFEKKALLAWYKSHFVPSEK